MLVVRATCGRRSRAAGARPHETAPAEATTEKTPPVTKRSAQLRADKDDLLRRVRRFRREAVAVAAHDHVRLDWLVATLDLLIPELKEVTALRVVP